MMAMKSKNQNKSTWNLALQNDIKISVESDELSMLFRIILVSVSNRPKMLILIM